MLSKRFTASCVMLAFFITQVFSPSIAQAFPLKTPGPLLQSADILSKLEIPKSLGAVEELFEGKSNRFVFFIQDAHTNLSAQKSIASIFDLLAGQFDISLLGQEGAEGEIDTALLRAFPIREATREVMERYLSRGVIGGPEYLAVTGARDFHFFGADKRKLYLRNLSEFLSVTDVRDRGLGFVHATRTAMKNLQNAVFSKSHRQLNELIARHQSGQIDLFSFVNKLKQIADENKVDTSMFSTLTMIAGISRNTDADTLKSLDAQRLLGEIEELSRALKELMARSPLEQKLVRLEEYLLLIEHGLHLELERKDTARLKSVYGEFTRENIRQFLSESSNAHSLKLSLGENFENPINDYFSLITGFYFTAEKRDRILAEQLLKEMRAEKKDMAVLVAGGFHKEGITRILRAEGISYAVISPSISEVTARDIYLGIMKNSRLLLDNPSRNTLGTPIPEGFPEIRRPFLNAATSEIVDVSRSRKLLRQYGVKDPSLLPRFVSDSFRQKGIIVFSGFGIAATDDDLLRAAERWDRRLASDLGATVEEMRESLVAAVRGTASSIPEIFSGEEIVQRGIESGDEARSKQSGAGFGRGVRINGNTIVAGLQILAWLFLGPRPERNLSRTGALALILNAFIFLPATTGVFFLGSYSYTPKLEAVLADPHGYLAAEWGGVTLLGNDGNIQSALHAAEKSLELEEEGHYDFDDNWVHEYYYIMPDEARSVLSTTRERLRGIDYGEAKIAAEDSSFEYSKEGNGRMIQDLERIEGSIPNASDDSGEYRTKKSGWFFTTDEFEESRNQLKQMAVEAKERGKKHYTLVPPVLRSDFEKGRLTCVLSWIWYVGHILATFTLWRAGFYNGAWDSLRSRRDNQESGYEGGKTPEDDRLSHSAGFGIQATQKVAERNVRIAMAQVNVKVGDLEGNFNKIVDYIRRAEDEDADIVVFPELALLGYPPEDLVLQPHVITNNLKWRDALISRVGNITAIVGFVDRDSEGFLYNAQAIISNGELKGVYHKQDLPNYDVFDEKRYFKPGKSNQIFDLNGVPLCINVCEDIWHDVPGVHKKQAEMGARLIINTSASPFRLGVENERLEVLRRGVRETGAVFVYTNLVGGQDELLFDGGSFVMAPDGQILTTGNRFEEDLVVTDVKLKVPENASPSNDIVSLAGSKVKEEKRPITPREARNLSEEEIIYRALVLGTRDYLKKNGFEKAVIGISGGIDSALVAAIAVDAIGKENVVGISMPTRYNTEGTKEDARLLARRLEIKFFESPIQIIFSVFLKIIIHFIVEKLEQLGWKKKGEVSEENLQARIRGAMLMFVSNFFGALVLSTGNKSELAVGYATLYGDMAGGFSPIKDLPKTKVFKLARYINARSRQERIPVSTIQRPPSAELRNGQRDTDALPPYEILDPILEAYIEKKQSIEEMSKTWDRATVERVVRLVVKTGEHKRRQAPPGPKITSLAFGKDWRMPITNGYDENRTPDERKADETSKYMSDEEYVAFLNSSIARGYPRGYPRRQIANPPTYTAKRVMEMARTDEKPDGYADTDLESLEGKERENAVRQIRERTLRIAPDTKFVDGLPRNSRETGLNGRGLLGLYGPNQSEDPVLLRYNNEGGLEVLLIQTGSSGATQIPGGFAKWGEELEFGVTATRELKEETYPDADFKIDFTKGALVYDGPVHSFRVTNDAWIVSRGIAVLLSYEQSTLLPLKAAGDARADSARFVSVSSDEVKNLGTQSHMIAEAVRKIRTGQIKVRDDAIVKDESGFGTESPRTAKDLAYIARLNQERPEGYPVRSRENPPVYTDGEVIVEAKSRTNPLGWAHPNLENSELSEADRNRIREEIRADIKRFAPHTKFASGMPKNRKETGMKGRGLLGRYGPNPAEDPVVLRHNEKGELEVLTIERGDGVAGRALPGGMDRWGDETKVGVTASRELYEETGIRLDLTEGMVVYEGPVEDWRDTNDAWIESRAVATLLSWEESKYLKPEASSDAKKDSAKWVKVNDPGNKFYARHGIIIANAVAKVMSGQLTSAEAKVMKKYPPLDITTRSLEEAYQAFRENRHQKEVYDLIAPVAPHGGNYLVAAGLEETLGAIRRRRFSKAHIQKLRNTGKFSEKFLKYLSEFIFEGDIDALQEGRVVSPGIPLLRVNASPVEIALLKDLIINRMAFSTNIATKTARISQAANGEFVDEETVQKLIKEYGMTREQIKRFRAILDFGQRRAQGRGATEASRAAVIGGAIATSNVKAAKMHYLEPSGTMAHFFIMLFPPDREIDAFRLYAKAFPHQTTLLVDTYDTIQGVKNAIIVAREMAERGEKLFGVRLDSGNIAKLSREVRKMLNDAGLHDVKIFASDDLDEVKITKLLSEGAELDGLGVGTNLITGGKQAYLDLKFVESKGERFWRIRHKGKIQRYITTSPGRTAHAAYAEEIFELLTPVWRGGERVFGVEKPWQAHLRAKEELNQWSPNQKKLEGSAPIPIEVQDNPLSINPKTDAVLDVDVSTTFMPGGGLPVREGDLILPNVRTIGNLFPKKRRFASVDRHPRGHMSLASSYEGYAPYTYLTYDEVSKWTDDDHKLAPHAKFTLAELKDILQKTGGQVLWTDHAEEGTEEGELHHQFLKREYEYVQVKGMNPATDSYSAFRDNVGNPTKLAKELRARGVIRLFVTGLAMDYCVGWSCEDAVKEGFEVFIVIDATRPVGFPEGSIDKMNASFAEKGIKVITTKELVSANNRMGVFPSTILPEPDLHPPVPEEDESSALEEDMYHLTMAQVLFNEGLHEKPATYDYFFRTPPYGDDKIIVSGVRFFMDEIRKFKFTAEDIEYLRKYTPYKFSDAFLDYLAHFEFKGDIDTLPEGSVAFAREPIIRVKGTALEIIIETLLLKRINFNNLMATWSNITRQSHGEDLRLNIDAVAGAQGQSHAEAMYSAFVGGSNATTDLDAHLNFGIPLAWSDDEGEWLGSDFITGGPKAALGGVYKLAEFDGEARIKLSDNPAKTSLPGAKEIVEINDSTGNVIRRVIKLQGEDLQINPGETAVPLLVPLIEKGKFVYAPPSTWAVQVFRRDQVRRYADIHESVLSEGLSRLQGDLVEQVRSAVSAATEVSGFGTESGGLGRTLKTTDGLWIQLDRLVPIAEEAERLSLAAIEELKALIKTADAEYNSIPLTGEADSVIARANAHSRRMRLVELNADLAGLAEDSRMLLNAVRNAHPVTSAHIFSSARGIRYGLGQVANVDKEYTAPSFPRDDFRKLLDKFSLTTGFLVKGGNDQILLKHLEGVHRSKPVAAIKTTRPDNDKRGTATFTMQVPEHFKVRYMSGHLLAKERGLRPIEYSAFGGESYMLEDDLAVGDGLVIESDHPNPGERYKVLLRYVRKVGGQMLFTVTSTEVIHASIETSLWGSGFGAHRPAAQKSISPSYEEEQKEVIHAVQTVLRDRSGEGQNKTKVYKTIVFSSAADLARFEALLAKYAPAIRAEVLGHIETVVAGWDVSEFEAHTIWNRLAHLFPRAVRAEQIYVRQKKAAFRNLRGIQAALLGKQTEYLIDRVDRYSLDQMQENGEGFIDTVMEALRLKQLTNRIATISA